MFSTHNKPLDPDHEVIKRSKGLDTGSKQNSVLSEYLFKENVKKETSLPDYEDVSSVSSLVDGQVLSDLKPAASVKNVGRLKEQQLEDSAHLNKQKRRELKRSYLSTISTKFNPDILVGDKFIRGTEYFAKAPAEPEKENSKPKKEKKVASKGGAKEEGEESYGSEENAKVAADEDSEDDFGALMKMKGSRYWAEENPTIKCHNCR